MTPHVYTYQDLKNQRTAFRGYVKIYNGTPTVIIKKCTEVHYIKAHAMNDAKKLIKKLKKMKMNETRTEDVEVAPGIYQSIDDYRANQRHDDDMDNAKTQTA